MQNLTELMQTPDPGPGTDCIELERLPAVTASDMAQVELKIAQHLCGEGGRCAWLRSQAYLRLRLTALYYPGFCKTNPIVLYHQGLRVTLLDGTVTLSRHLAGQGSFWQTLEELGGVQDEARREILQAKHSPLPANASGKRALDVTPGIPPPPSRSRKR